MKINIFKMNLKNKIKILRKTIVFLPVNTVLLYRSLYLLYVIMNENSHQPQTLHSVRLKLTFSCFLRVVIFSFLEPSHKKKIH